MRDDKDSIDKYLDSPYETRPMNREKRMLQITVFTSKSCLLCEQAMATVREVARRVRQYGPEIEIVEHVIDELNNADSLRIDTLPSIRIGERTLVGLPSPDDIENIINIDYLLREPD